MFGHTNTQVQVADFILTQTGTYQEQAIRPFTTHITQNDVNALEVATQGGRNLGPTTVQGIASNIIRPDANVEGRANIAEGWQSRRFRFLMRVEERHPFNMAERVQRIYFGYTDHCDASMNHLDPQMRIYFNSETVVRDIIRPTPNGNVVDTIVVASNQIISPMDMAGPTPQVSAYYPRPVAYMIRPEDIFNRGQMEVITNKMHSTGVIEGVDVQYDARTMVGQGGGYKYSRRRDTTPSRYLSETLQAYRHATDEVSMMRDYDQGMDKEVLYGEAQSHLRNQNIHDNPFFAKLKDESGFMERGYVTLAELNQIFPETQLQYGVTKYSMDTGQSIRLVSHVEDSEHWVGSDNITIAATTLAQVVPAIMMDNYIRSISFAATNGTGGLGSFAIDIHEGTLRGVVSGLQLAPHLQKFERRLIFDALAPLTHNNQVGFQISMSSDLAGDSIIDIAMDGEPLRRYIAPTFTDSLFTPVVTHNYERHAGIASDLLFLMEQTVQATPTHHTSPIVTNSTIGGGFGHGHPQQSSDAYHNPYNTMTQGNNDDDYSGLL